MSAKEYTLTVEKRDLSGPTVRALRREGTLPAVIHDHGKESIVIMAPTREVVKAYEHVGEQLPISLQLDGKKITALIKDVDLDPKNSQLRHVVFNAINQNEKTHTEVDVVLVGDAPAEKIGLVVVHHNEQISIEALPKDLVDELEVDATKLAEIGDKLHVSDIVAPTGVTILTEPEHLIAAVEEKTVQVVEEEPAATEEIAEDAASTGEEKTEEE